MQSLALVLSNRAEDGVALPCPIEAFEDNKIRFKRGQMSLIAGAPGGGKSALATHLAVRMAYSEDEGVPALYVCADSDTMTVGANVLAGLMDVSIDEAEAMISGGDTYALQTMDALVDHIWWMFKSSPTLQDIENELQAYAYVYGDYPHLIVVDNLMDILEPGEEYSRYNEILLWLVDKARETNAHVLVLHHVVGLAQDGDKPIARSQIKHKTSEKPSLVLTLFRPEEGFLGVRVVKNRSGPANTKGELGFDLPWNPSRAWFGEEIPIG